MTVAVADNGHWVYGGIETFAGFSLHTKALERTGMWESTKP
jgi:hypothetical protein